jgi:hypothetical protein
MDDARVVLEEMNKRRSEAMSLSLTLEPIDASPTLVVYMVTYAKELKKAYKRLSKLLRDNDCSEEEPRQLNHKHSDCDPPRSDKDILFIMLL